MVREESPAAKHCPKLRPNFRPDAVHLGLESKVLINNQSQLTPQLRLWLLKWMLFLLNWMLLLPSLAQILLVAVLPVLRAASVSHVPPLQHPLGLSHRCASTTGSLVTRLESVPLPALTGRETVRPVSNGDSVRP